MRWKTGWAWVWGVAAVSVLARPAAAQPPLTLADAMARARTVAPAARAATASQSESEARIQEARAGYFPRVDLTESVQRGNQPVYVFSSLLSQRQFTADRFDIATLNHPDPLTNVQTSITFAQPIFDAGATTHAVHGAELARDLATVQRSAVGQDLALAAAAAFVRVLQLEAEERAAGAAVAAAESDLARARARRDVGLVTDADVLSVDVHLAGMRQRQIQAGGDLDVARLQLRDAVGLPLDAPLVLAPPEPRVTTGATPEGLLAEAVRTRPELRQSDLRQRVADNARAAAKAAFWPSVGVQGAWQFNGDTFRDQRSGWLVGVQAQLHLFQGTGDTARLTALTHGQVRAAAEREGVERSIAVDVRAAIARLETARARQSAGRAALAQARESQRIVRDRYETGLAGVTDVLRAAEAALDAESRAIAADMDVTLQSVALDRAVGRL